MIKQALCSGIATAGAVAGLVLTSPAHADESISTPVSINDIDGDGLVDVVFAEPDHGVEWEEGIGSINVAYGDGETQRVSTPGQMGEAVVADLNGDQYADVVATSDPEDADSVLLVHLGSPDGLSDDADFVRTDRGATSLAVLGGPTPLIVVGDASATVGGVASGALRVYPVHPNGRPGPAKVISQKSPGVPGNNEVDDRFGASVATDGDTLVVGSPGEATTRVEDTGMIHVLRRTGTTTFTGVGFHQDTTKVPGTAEKGDHFGAAVAIDEGRVAVGAPGEDIGSTADAGMVTHFTDNGTSTTVAGAFNQNTTAIPGSNQAGDEFGSSVSFTRPCSDRTAIIVGASEDEYAVNRSTVVNLGTGTTCANRLVPGAAVSLRSSVATGQVDAVVDFRYVDDDPLSPALELRTYPYSSVATLLASSDSEAGLRPLPPLAR